MAPRPSAEEMAQLQDMVFCAARDNQPQVIQDCLASLPPDVIKDIVDQTSTHQSDHVTPLVVAILNGHLEVVRLLVRHFNVDVRQMVEWMHRRCSPLFVAVSRDNLDMVEVLVGRGRDTGPTKRDMQSAVTLACSQNNLGVLKFLVENGAPIDHSYFRYGENVLMTACGHRNCEMVQFLLCNGADINRQNSSKETALHKAANANAPDVIKLLVKNGARFSIDNGGNSPLLRAAKEHCSDAVDALLECIALSPEDRVEALELVGARLSMNNINKAFRYVCQGMRERHQNPASVPRKPHSPLPTFSHLQESQSLEELQARRHDPHLFRLECLAIVSRILGPAHIYTVGSFSAYVSELKVSGRDDEAMAILMHAMKAAVLNAVDQQVAHKIVGMLRDFCEEMLSKKTPGLFSDLVEVLTLILDRIESHDGLFEYRVDVKTWLLCILLALTVAEGQNEGRRLQVLTERFIPLAHSPVLHTAVGLKWDVLSGLAGLPFDLLVSFLVHRGANVHAWDRSGNQVLHIVACLSHKGNNIDLLSEIVNILLRAGALVGVQNREGRTPLDLAAPALAAELQDLYPVSLKSLAASAVLKHQISYVTEIPHDLLDFVESHRRK